MVEFSAWYYDEIKQAPNLMAQGTNSLCHKFWEVGKLNHKGTKDTKEELLRNQHPKINDTDH